jgi:hypothetical protein
MACLSVFNEDAKLTVVCANPIYLNSSSRIQANATLVFDVLYEDASSLKNMIGSLQIFALESQAFWGTLSSLEPTGSLFGKPALRGSLMVQTILNEHESSTDN